MKTRGSVDGIRSVLARGMGGAGSATGGGRWVACGTKGRQVEGTLEVGSDINVGGINVFDSEPVIAFETALEKFNDCFIQK